MQSIVFPPFAAEIPEGLKQDEGQLALPQPDGRGQSGPEERPQDQQDCQRGEFAFKAKVGPSFGTFEGRLETCWMHSVNSQQTWSHLTCIFGISDMPVRCGYGSPPRPLDVPSN